MLAESSDHKQSQAIPTGQLLAIHLYQEPHSCIPRSWLKMAPWDRLGLLVMVSGVSTIPWGVIDSSEITRSSVIIASTKHICYSWFRLKKQGWFWYKQAFGVLPKPPSPSPHLAFWDEINRSKCVLAIITELRVISLLSISPQTSVFPIKICPFHLILVQFHLYQGELFHTKFLSIL